MRLPAEILDARERTHGRFERTALLSQQIKALLAGSGNWGRGMTLAQQEALSMIAVKMARIAEGDAHHADHWDDIAGYAALIARGIPR